MKNLKEVILTDQNGAIDSMSRQMMELCRLSSDEINMK